MPRLSLRSVAAFTLLELMTVITVILILAVMTISVLGDIKNRAEIANCTTNIKSLYTAASAYVSQNGHWPQIATVTLKNPHDTVFASAWISALKPFGIDQKNWICPTIQREMHNPDLSQSVNVRIDYMPTPFDNRAGTPYLWAHQPWFMEVGAVHPGGNLVMFTNGQVLPLQQALQYQLSSQ